MLTRLISLGYARCSCRRHAPLIAAWPYAQCIRLGACLPKATASGWTMLKWRTSVEESFLNDVACSHGRMYAVES